MQVENEIDLQHFFLVQTGPTRYAVMLRLNQAETPAQGQPCNFLALGQFDTTAALVNVQDINSAKGYAAQKVY
jgi:hypothetical protein